MLYPTLTDTRSLIDLSGVWKFYLDDGSKDVAIDQPLETTDLMAVPGSFNDQGVLSKIRNHAGTIWYEREFSIPQTLLSERLVLRFGSATHQATVYVNGQKVVEHKGGFLPFEAEINGVIQRRKNRLLVEVSTLLDYTTLPVGNHTQSTDEHGRTIHHVDENFDFFNYAGLHRPVKIYSTPQTYIEDIVLAPSVNGEDASVQTSVQVVGDYDQVMISILDEDGNKVAGADTPEATITIEQAHLWEPMNAYLYTAHVEVVKEGEVIDEYDEPFGIRTVEVKEGQFFINQKPFYFKGFGKHEDTYYNGRGLNETANVMDLNLFKWIGANSFRTSHYPYSEEMMRLADRMGIVVIDEVPAVGLFSGFSALLTSGSDVKNTWDEMKTHEAHEQAIRELIQRDKNHAAVVMWVIANEPASHQDGAHEYFEPLVHLAKELDPQKRPTTIVNIMFALPDVDQVLDLVDVVSLNRYYGWYLNSGDLQTAEKALRAEIEAWIKKHPEKPILFTEYGADTVAGFHAIDDIPFTEEYQVRYYEMYHRVFDEFKQVTGEQVWNFADFETKVGTARVQGNKKGIFTRERQPKMLAHELRKRWTSIPDYDYK
ncbi:beta-glucuronidase [Jeotgalibaca caeni]|uniref:beta-glucuronidase n=1 Tax=Jeotgalibaca caeni TaxID=3028623 RepID=UPI00237EE7F0|nr:beta-glucuronidase [Jeotgalibaca caeni]MDE1549216.1 beta-glucuronidase [Jeotgalibaca caeni]